LLGFLVGVVLFSSVDVAVVDEAIAGGVVGDCDVEDNAFAEATGLGVVLLIVTGATAEVEPSLGIVLGDFWLVTNISNLLSFRVGLTSSRGVVAVT
jgi:hypothetical protein